MKHLNLWKTNLLFLLLAFTTIQAQTHRFYYSFRYRMDTIDFFQNTTMVLDVNKDKNIFFDRNYLDAHLSNDEIANPNFSEILIKDKTDNNFTFIKNLSMNYYQYSTPIDIKWEITLETKKIGEFNVQKAKTEYSGRQWEAWFCNDIPFPYGPYFFYGLPGLVLEVYDTNANFHFQLIETKKIDNYQKTYLFLEKYFKPFLVKIQKKDWAKMQINYYNNPLNEYKNGNAYMLNENGEQYTSNDYKELEAQIKKQIKRFNNPIELNEKVNY